MGPRYASEFFFRKALEKLPQGSKLQGTLNKFSQETYTLEGLQKKSRGVV